MDNIRVGIIGTGGISRAHQGTYMRVGGFEIVAVCDIIKEKALQAAKDWGVTYFKPAKIPPWVIRSSVHGFIFWPVECREISPIDQGKSLDSRGA